MGRRYRPEESLPDGVVVDGVCMVFFAMAADDVKLAASVEGVVPGKGGGLG